MGAADIAVPPVRRAGVPVKLSFAVGSIDAVRGVMLELGGVAELKATQWEHRGWTHCDGVDPEGNVVQMREPEASPVWTGGGHRPSGQPGR